MVPRSATPTGMIALAMALALTLALTLSGCVGGPAPTPRYYLLTPDMAPAAATRRPPRVRIGELRLPQYLERPHIVTRTAANRLELADYHQWAGNLRKDMVQVLARNLARRLATPYVSLPAAPLVNPDVVVEVTVMQFEQGPDGRVGLAAGWRLVDGSGREELAAGLSELASAPLPATADYAAVVAAMSGVYGELAAEIAGAIRTRVVAGD